MVSIQREARLRCRETTKATSLVLRKGTMAMVKVKRDNFFKKLIALGYKTRAVARVERDKFGYLEVNSKVHATLATTHISNLYFNLFKILLYIM